MTVFSTKNLEDSLRPIAFYIILDFVWTRIRRDLRKRVLIVEEAWYLMANEDSAKFIYGIAKRARKYYLGLTTITQDVDDFLRSEYGKAIVSNSSIHVLFKQHPSAIDRVAQVFYLSEGEKRLLLAAGIGEGLFFAGANHVSIKVMASPDEHNLVTTNPEELLRLREQGVIATPKPSSRITFGELSKNQDRKNATTTTPPASMKREEPELPKVSPNIPKGPPVPSEQSVPEEKTSSKTEYVYDNPNDRDNPLDIDLQKEDMDTKTPAVPPAVPPGTETGDQRDSDAAQQSSQEAKKDTPQEAGQGGNKPVSDPAGKVGQKQDTDQEEDHMPTAKDIIDSVEDLVPDTTPSFEDEPVDTRPNPMNTPGHIIKRKSSLGLSSNEPTSTSNTHMTPDEVATDGGTPTKGFSFPNPFAKKESMLEDTVPVQEETSVEQKASSLPPLKPIDPHTGEPVETPLVNPDPGQGQMTPMQAVQQATQFREEKIAAKELSATMPEASSPQTATTPQPQQPQQLRPQEFTSVALDQQEPSGEVDLNTQNKQQRPFTSNKPM
jgi:hypothetical protein